MGKGESIGVFSPSGIEFVGVGFPNPSDERSTGAFSPRGAACALCLNHGLIRIRRGRVIRFCLSLQRSDMSIAARHIQSPRSRGAQCALCLNHGLHGFNGKHRLKNHHATATIEFVGVGFPNPSDEKTKPLRWMPRLEFWCVGAFRSRGAICL